MRGAAPDAAPQSLEDLVEISMAAPEFTGLGHYCFAGRSMIDCEPLIINETG